MAQPPAIMVVGMAGSGKTTFMQRLNAHLHEKKEPPYIVNLDPAVKNVPFDRHIDIRDSVNYKQVMKQYVPSDPSVKVRGLPVVVRLANGIDQVIGILEKRAPTISRILVDTPGQIECFVWSASGAIVTDALASSFPTVLAYVIDTPRTTSTSTFMSNMLYACSILYKTKLPMIIVFNKTDVQDAAFAKEWMTDFEAFQAALRQEEEKEDGSNSGYMSSLMNSMSLMLDEFYNHLDVVSVSSMTGAGIDDFFKAVDSKVEEYKKDYLPELEKARKEREEKKKDDQNEQLDRLMSDMKMSGSTSRKPKKDVKISASEPEIDTLSDAADSDDELMEGDQDVEDNTNDGRMGDDSLVDRYERALHPDGRQDDVADESFMRYLNAPR
ncbi:hypothetical protein H072_9725 [Dactylellina haptotyla CBS 200.50]|uniref:GPN-loop GTPase n=1 Tax=Dactylellina haptotyla (strain CBS 200.50) TaxID=1284197 RepID=S8BN72_DACHA|nr:hypothetical protein H072_9725 [Dactylellina haptotyla CBS 200.50]